METSEHTEKRHWNTTLLMGRKLHRWARPGRPSYLTGYYKTEHLKFSGCQDYPFSSYRSKYKRLFRTHRIGEKDAVLRIHTLPKRPAIHFYQNQIQHRYFNVQDPLDRIQAHFDSLVMLERVLAE